MMGNEKFLSHLRIGRDIIVPIGDTSHILHCSFLVRTLTTPYFIYFIFSEEALYNWSKDHAVDKLNYISLFFNEINSVFAYYNSGSFLK